MNNEIIVIEQLPIITQRLQTIKADVTARVSEVMSLVCTEDTVKEIKKSRAELNKELTYWEDKRKEVKKAIIAPYEQFETVYKDCISDVFKKADADLKGKIDSVESELKEKKAEEVKAYFYEYLESTGIDFVLFESAGINVTLSASLKSLKEQAKAFIDRICDDLHLIDTQDHKDEILYLYKKIDGFAFLNVSKSIAFVLEKYRAIEAEKARSAEQQAKAEAEQKAVEKVEAVAETLAPPTEEEKVLTLKFTVRGTLPQLKALKEFLNNGGYEYE